MSAPAQLHTSSVHTQLNHKNARAQLNASSSAHIRLSHKSAHAQLKTTAQHQWCAHTAQGAPSRGFATVQGEAKRATAM